MHAPSRQRLGKCLRAGDFKYYFKLIRIDFFAYLPFFLSACFSSTTT